MLHAICKLSIITLLAFTSVGSGNAAHISTERNGQSASRTRGDWPHFGNSTDQTRFSPLTQINAGNVRRLGVAWTMPEGLNLVLWETDPVVVDGVMYLTTGTDQVIAVDAATGKVRWKYTPTVNFLSLLAGGGSDVPVNRGVEVANGRVYLLTFDDQLIALDAATGKRLWSTTVASAQAGYSEPSPPTYWHGLLFVGSAEGDAGLRGFIAAYDARTGKQVWRFYTVPAPGHSWMPAGGAHGGGDVWMPATIDARTGILYAGTGNPSPDLVNTQRPGCNPWADATLALQARTGKLIWARTQVCPDVWDYDADQTPMLLTVRKNGKAIRAVGSGNKSGYYWIFDAATGETLAKSPPLARQTLPRPFPSRQGAYVCPGEFGGLEYSPPGYSPHTHDIYLPGLDMCMIYKRDPQRPIDKHATGAPDLGGSVLPGKEKPTGFMAAIDANTGAIRWRVKVPGPMIGGALATAGNLVFSGADDGHVYAFDARSGRILWKPDLGLGFGAAPIAYAVDGVEYIAIAAGGSSVASLTGAGIGGTLVVFKLDGKPVRKLPASGT